MLEDPKYEVLGSCLGLANEEFELVFVPQKEVSLPVYIYNNCNFHGGKVLFENDENKRLFIEKAYKDKKYSIVSFEKRVDMKKNPRL